MEDKIEQRDDEKKDALNVLDVELIRVLEGKSLKFGFLVKIYVR